MSSYRGLAVAIFTGGFLFVGTGCGPTYPKCENDEHCAEKGEYCLNGKCAQCRSNDQCEGPGMECSAGRCTRRVGYCDDSVPCPGNGKCRDNQCGPQCLNNDECTGNTYCSGGSCIQKPECGEGSDNPACPDGQDCVGGRCEVRLAQCTTEPVYFAFNRSDIRGGERGKLDTLAACLKGDNAGSVQVAGHCDERGTEEYNLALGERRAEAARRYLTNLGVAAGKLSTISYGEERPAVRGGGEGAWSKNRRSEFTPR